MRMCICSFIAESTLPKMLATLWLKLELFSVLTYVRNYKNVSIIMHPLFAKLTILIKCISLTS